MKIHSLIQFDVILFKKDETSTIYGSEDILFEKDIDEITEEIDEESLKFKEDCIAISFSSIISLESFNACSDGYYFRNGNISLFEEYKEELFKLAKIEIQKQQKYFEDEKVIIAGIEMIITKSKEDLTNCKLLTVWTYSLSRDGCGDDIREELYLRGSIDHDLLFNFIKENLNV
jgi:hypothetical protein